MVTHDEDLAHQAGRTVTIADGHIVSDTRKDLEAWETGEGVDWEIGKLVSGDTDENTAQQPGTQGMVIDQRRMRPRGCRDRTLCQGRGWASGTLAPSTLHSPLSTLPAPRPPLLSRFPRWAKVLRDLWSHKTRSLLVVLSIAIGVFAIGVIAGTQTILGQQFTGTYLGTNPAHATLSAG